MKITTCLPLSKQHGLETLTYYTDTIYPIGSIISIPIRRKEYLAVVIEQSDISGSKTEVKSLSYNLRQLPKSTPIMKLPENFIKAIFKTANQYAGEASTVIEHVLNHLEFINESNTIIEPGKHSEPIIWQAKYWDFYTELRRLTKDKKNKILVITSDKNELDFYQHLLAELDPLVLKTTSSKSKKDKIADSDLIITTRGLGPILTLTHNVVIVVNPGGDIWRDRRRPYYQTEELITELGTSIGRQVIKYSSVASQEDWLLYLESKKKQIHFVNHAYKPNKHVSLIERAGGHKNELDSTLDRRVQNLITNNHNNERNTVLYVTRRGLYPVLACNDCKTTTYTKAFLEQVQRYNIAKSATDWVDPNTAQEWTDRCPECGSWRLYPVALSIGQTEKAVLEIIPKDSLFVIDTISQKPSESKKIIKEFNKTKGGVLLTTQRGIYQLDKIVDDVVVVSLDAALSSNSLSIETQMLRLLYHLESLAEDKLVIQTRLENNHVLRTFTSGKVRVWQQESIDQRKQLNFPPFATQIKLVVPASLNCDTILKMLNQLKKASPDINYCVLPGLSPSTSILVTVPTNYWQSKNSSELKHIIKSLALDIKAIVNPDILM